MDGGKCVRMVRGIHKSDERGESEEKGKGRVKEGVRIVERGELMKE